MANYGSRQNMVDCSLSVRRRPSLVGPIVSAMPATDNMMNVAEDSDENPLNDDIAVPKVMREPHQERPPAGTDAKCTFGSEYSQRGICTGQLVRLGHHRIRPRHLDGQSYDSFNPAHLDAFRFWDHSADYRTRVRGGLADPNSLHYPTPNHPPSLRTRLSRFFHSNRRPKGEKPLHLHSRMPQAQEQGQMPYT